VYRSCVGIYKRSFRGKWNRKYKDSKLGHFSAQGRHITSVNTCISVVMKEFEVECGHGGAVGQN
jgi:hypothetical protein